MLTQLIYRSRAAAPILSEDLESLRSSCEQNNKHDSVSGIMCFDGEYFLQVLEGGESALDALMTRITADRRHKNIVIIFKEPVGFARFKPFGMRLFDIRNNPDQLNSMSELMTAYGDLRIPKILNAFTQGLWHDSTRTWSPFLVSLPRETPDLNERDLADIEHHHACFAFQPLVDLQTQTITAYEALIRGRNGQSAFQLMSSMQGDTLHRFDLESKAWALQTASKLGITCTLAMNLLPQSLTFSPDAVPKLLDEIALYGFKTSQILLEVTEEELIVDVPLFMKAVDTLRAAGVRFAIDDFGAGYAGLSLLADFQPDKLKIDRRIVSGIHNNGPRQAIVWSVVEFCKRLGITVVAEGVETMEELQWLHAAGVERIQGFLFAKPAIRALPIIEWQNFLPQ
jgi:blue light- and temperature-responsive anti-repressor